LQLDTSTDYTGITWQTSPDGSGGTEVTPVCFCRGTRILTDRGEVPVEALAVGDLVVTLSGMAKPIRWIGLGRDLVTQKNPLARPIIVRAGALADGVPRRDLYLTHGHALYLDGVLVPVEQLVNHCSIRWDEGARVVEYYHIELDDHDVVLAEGAPAESYYDAGNRAQFHNTRPRSTPGTEQAPCAPVLTGGEVVKRLWARFFERAGGCSATETSDDPDLHLVVDGARLDPASVAGGVYTFALTTPPAGPLHLRSRSTVPSLTGGTRHDHRRLGVALRQIILTAPGVMTTIDHDASLLRDGGCHLPEAGHSWTAGDLTLPAALFAHLTGGCALIVHTSRQALRYPASAPPAVRFAA
ncbi:MAG TPA: Hint domain-containing protein, partial [Stellaceae bacterium]|nr:Hint domain-containing protein [Stellaceae bacterium]